MECKQFWQQYEDSGLDDDLRSHLSQCESCREEMEIEKALGRMTDELPREKAPEGLWEKVQHAVPAREPEKPKTVQLNTAGRRKRYLYAAAAAVLIMISSLSIQYLSSATPEELARDQMAAIAEIEQNEKEYLASIERLSKLVEEKKDTVDSELFTLYKQRLEVLDDVILLCKEAIEENRYNINARMYLAEAYREKVNTLKKIAELS